MLTGRSRMRGPGIFAASDSDTPSFGCSVSTRWFGRTPTDPSRANSRCGTGLSVTAISVSLACEPLARAQVERHARPAPVVDLEPQRGERLGAWIRADARLVEVAGHGLAADDARGILARARRPAGRTRRAGASAIARSTFTFSLRTSSAANASGRLHRDMAEQLEHVVLHQVAERAGRVVVAGAAADADVLRAP